MAVCAAELLVIGLMALAMLSTPSVQGFPAPWSLLAIGAALGFIALGSPSIVTPRTLCRGRVPSPLINALLGCHACAYVGRLSYPLYLWHWPIFVICRWTLDLSYTGVRVFALLLTALAALVTYHLVEKPVRRWRPRRQWHVLALMLASVMALELSLAALRGPLLGKLYHLGTAPLETGTGAAAVTPAAPPAPPAPPAPSPPPPASPAPSPPPPLPAYPPAVPLGMPQMPPPPPSQPPPPSPPMPPMTPPPSPPGLPPPPPPSPCACSNEPGTPGHTLHSPPDADPHAATRCFEPNEWPNAPLGERETEYSRDPCWFDGNGDSSVEQLWSPRIQQRVSTCLTPDRGPSQPRALFLVGDSHAAMIKDGLERAVRGRMSVRWVARPNCAYFPDALIEAPCCCYDGYERVRPIAQYRDHITTVLRSQLQAGDVLAFSAWFDHHLLPAALELYRTQVIPLLRERNASLLLISDGYSLTTEPRLCVNTPSRCNRLHGDEVRTYQPLSQEARLFADQFENVRYYSWADLLCDGTDVNSQCGSVVPGTSVSAYHDVHHLSRSGAGYLWPYLCSEIERMR